MSSGVGPRIKSDFPLNRVRVKPHPVDNNIGYLGLRKGFENGLEEVPKSFLEEVRVGA
jgi:hypothetical protein